MNRLTTNKEVSEMNMIELAYNSCYAKDGRARYRDFDEDIDARELAIKLLEEHADIPNDFTCDDDFDDFMADSLQYGTDDMLGLIAVFYRNLCAIADLRERLKKYEDLEEQGKLLELPCAVGSTVYKIYPNNLEDNISEKIVAAFSREAMLFSDHVGLTPFSEIGKTIFLTKEEAESALDRMEEKEENDRS